VRIHSRPVTPDLIDISQDEELILERLQRLEDTFKIPWLNRSRNTQAEENVEGPNGNFRFARSGQQGARKHLFQQGQTNGYSSKTTKEGTARQGIGRHEEFESTETNRNQ
jgi:hypothetical protein